MVKPQLRLRLSLAVVVLCVAGASSAQVSSAEVDGALKPHGCRRTGQRDRVVFVECGADVRGYYDLTNLDRGLERTHAPAERSRMIESFFAGAGVRVARELPRQLLYVVLKPKAVLETEMARARDSGHPVRLAGLRWIDDLVIVPVVDTPSVQTFVARELIERWKTSMEEVLRIATENLEALEDLPVRRTLPGGRPIAAYESDDGYAAARVLSESGRKAIERLLGGAAVYAVPRRDLLLAVRRDDPAAIAELRKLAAAENAYDYPLTHELVVFDGNRPLRFDETRR